MANSLTALDRNRPSAVAQRRRTTLLDYARTGLPPSYGVMTYKGRNFRIKYRSEEVLLRDGATRKPVSYVDVVIVGVSPAISRQFFPRQYTEGDTDGPICYATDGVKPDVGVPEQQSPLCATCKWSQWGSRVTDNGKRAKACQETRRIAVVPSTDIMNETFGGPLLLRVPPMSLYNLSNYSDFLGAKGASFETVVTRISFDEDVAYPRLTFEAVDWLSEEQQIEATGEDGNGGICASPLLDRMLSTPESPLAVRANDTPVSMPAPRQPVREPPPEEEEAEEPEEEPEDQEETAPPPPQPKPKPVAQQAKPKPQLVSNFQEEIAPPKRTKKANGATQQQSLQNMQVEADMEAALDNLLGE
jgi:hypothetical protein